MSLIEMKAAETAESLRHFHRMGIEANELASNAKYGDMNKIVKAIAAKFGRTRANVIKARAFAKRVKTSELEKICQLRNSKGAAFGPGMVPSSLHWKSGRTAKGSSRYGKRHPCRPESSKRRSK